MTIEQLELEIASMRIYAPEVQLVEYSIWDAEVIECEERLALCFELSIMKGYL